MSEFSVFGKGDDGAFEAAGLLTRGGTITGKLRRWVKLLQQSRDEQRDRRGYYDETPD
jgi:hypothetical protein